MGIAGYSVKNVKTTIGCEGGGILCSIYRDGKRVARYADYGDGAGGVLYFISKEEKDAYYDTIWNKIDSWINAEKAVDRDSFEAGPLRRLLDLTAKNLKQASGYGSLSEKYESMSHIYPSLHIKKEDITPERITAMDPDIFVQTLIYIKEMSDFLRKNTKKYPGTYVCVFGDGAAKLLPNTLPPVNGCVYTTKTEADFDF